MPRPSSHKAKALLGQPERSFEEGSTTDVASMGHFKLVGSYIATDPGGGCNTRRQ